MKLKEKPASFLKILHYLSLDVVVGAMVSSWMFWKLPLGSGVSPKLALPALGLATWFIYLADRLLDIRDPGKALATARHRFFYQHQYNIQILTIACGLSGLIISFFLPASVLLPGLIIAISMAGYFFLINRTLHLTRFFILTKELAVSVIYPAAVAGIPLYNRSSIHLSDWILLGFFTLLTFQNLLTFSWFEYREESESPNIIRLLGNRTAGKIIRGISLTLLFFSIFLFGGNAGYTTAMAWLLTTMSLTLSFMTALPDYFQHQERYRWVGDMIFIYPLLLFLF